MVFSVSLVWLVLSLIHITLVIYQRYKLVFSCVIRICKLFQIISFSAILHAASSNWTRKYFKILLQILNQQLDLYHLWYKSLTNRFSRMSLNVLSCVWKCSNPHQDIRILSHYTTIVYLLWSLFIGVMLTDINFSLENFLFGYLSICVCVCLCLQASIAKLETSVSFVGDKLELKVYGFNDKLPALLSKLLSVARSFIPTDDRFKVCNMFLCSSIKLFFHRLFSFLVVIDQHWFGQVIKEDMKRTLKNTNMKPLNHSSYLRLQVLCKSFYDVDEKLFHLNNLFLDDLKAFIPELHSQVDMTYWILVQCILYTHYRFLTLLHSLMIVVWILTIIGTAIHWRYLPWKLVGRRGY